MGRPNKGTGSAGPKSGTKATTKITIKTTKK